MFLFISSLLSRLHQSVFYCCDKTLRPKALREGRVYLYLWFRRDKSPSKSHWEVKHGSRQTWQLQRRLQQQQQQQLRVQISKGIQEKDQSRDNEVEMAESFETSKCSPSDRPPVARTCLLNLPPKAPVRDKYSNVRTMGTADSSHHREQSASLQMCSVCLLISSYLWKHPWGQHSWPHLT